MKYSQTTPCKECPFLESMSHGFTLHRLKQFAQSEFPCHKSASEVDNEEDGRTEFVANKNSVQCAGALIFLEKRKAPNQMMRIAERLGMYDYTKLNMDAPVR